MFQKEVLILKFVSINTFPARPIMPGEIASLTHELRNDAVEDGFLEAEAFFVCAKGAEIFRRFWTGQRNLER